MAASSAAALAGRTFEQILQSPSPSLSAGVGALLDMASFWRAAGPERYFAQSDEFDNQLISRYSTIYPAVSTERLVPSSSSNAEEHLGMILLLDQYPRNAFRGSPKQYASDSLALKYANIALNHGLDDKVEDAMKQFLYLPFGHSERIEDQDTGIKYGEKVGGLFLSHAKEHREVIKRFGRFPHRNGVLGRDTTEEENVFLANEKPAWAKS